MHIKITRYRQKSLMYYFTIVFALQLLILSLLSFSCVKTETREYKNLQLQADAYYLSFDYPIDYSGPWITFISDWPKTTISMVRPLKDEEYNDIALYIYTMGYSQEDINLSSMMDEENYTNYSDFKQLQRLSITVGDQPAEKIVYTWSQYLEDDKYIQTVTEEVLFTYEGLLISFRISADEKVYDVANKDLKHILETFKILE